ncbi:chitinase [Francisella adeliensis]|uniref:Chitinase n=1 Tax=Francisella adeliensis TaxID=2007306 RepID=A0A2Z4XZ74_9GAMM|nr:chitinase [Francisella adeliensis]AXA34167.1 chitinase [Francisella adeliensis]MBK2085524.1 chitinase [Francisella adeliensis]MBK2096354.1 chitinase [Francisella adeliensis]QIW12411.1 chitinase [Francisella adeliensis]QIW14285.1 chitinase [Francisella adeliensis]
MKKLNLISATTLALLSSTAFADCKVEDVKNGWSGSIEFSCDKDTNLMENPINIKLSDNAKIGSVWGLNGETHVTTKDGVTSIAVEKHWPKGKGVILKAGQSATVSFSPSTPKFSLASLSIGDNSADTPDTPDEPTDPVDPVDPIDPVDPPQPSGDYPLYEEGFSYKSGDIVEVQGKLYQCKEGVSAWCSSAAWAYAPSTGTAWDSAWKIYNGDEPVDPIDPVDPVNPDDPTPTPGDVFETTQAELDKKETELTSGPVMKEVKKSIRTIPNEVVEAVEPGLPNNPENVKRVESIVSSQDWEFLFPERAPEYTYSNFLKAVAKFPAFCGTYTDGRDSDAICKKSLATMFAHFAQETGGHTAHWDVPEWRQALVHVREMGWNEAMLGGYNGECNPNVWQGQTWPCGKFNTGEFKSYFGRGAKQLSYNYNYGPFSQAIYGDVTVLLNNPELVADTWLNLASAVFFFVYPQPPKPSMLHVIDGTWQPNSSDKANGLTPGFGVTTQIINGGVECGGANEIAQSLNRIDYYDNFTKHLGVNISNDEVLGCKGMKQFDAQGAGATNIFWEQDFSYNAKNPEGKSFACKLVGYQTPYSAFTQGDYGKCVKHHFPSIIIK